MSHVTPLNGNSNGHHPFRPKIVSRKTDQELAYAAALDLVAEIDDHLLHGTKHYRTKSGHLLRTLDQVVNAILDDTLLVEAEDSSQQQLRRVA